MSERAPWQPTWVPLTPSAAPPRRAGADDYLRHPSRIGDEQRPYTLGQIHAERTRLAAQCGKQRAAGE